jgi:hypothetical protein
MAETRIVHRIDDDFAGYVVCGRQPENVLIDGHESTNGAAFRFVPQPEQCYRCRDFAVRLGLDVGPVPAAHILSVSILCLSLHGSLAHAPAPIRALLASAISGDMEAAAVLLDAVEERGAVEVDWPVREEHRHVWLKYTAQVESLFRYWRGEPLRRCTCGIFQHDHEMELELERHSAGVVTVEGR